MIKKNYLLLISFVFLVDVYPYSIYELLKQDMLVFDVGAHIGNKTAEYSQYGCKVVCFEPNPKNTKILQRKFKNNPDIFIEAKALGKSAGSITLNICSCADTISTCNQKWMTGRFANYTWDKKIKVPLTTLDLMIEKYGTPDYCKIDVEGFEISVLEGLSQPIKCLSFEFTKEFADDALICLNHLHQIGFNSFNIACGESPEFIFPENQPILKIMDFIKKSLNQDLWGDIYAFSN